VLWGWPGGPTVPPGTYQARMTVGEWSDTTTVEVIQDPRIDVPQEEMFAQYALAKAVWQELSRSHEAISRIREVRGQIETLAKRVDDEALTEKADAIAEALTAVEEKLHQTNSESSQDILNFPPQIDNQLLYLQGVVESTLGAPSQSSQQRFDELRRALDGYVSELDTILSEQLPELERLVGETGAPRIIVDDREG